MNVSLLGTDSRVLPALPVEMLVTVDGKVIRASIERKVLAPLLGEAPDDEDGVHCFIRRHRRELELVVTASHVLAWRPAGSAPRARRGRSAGSAADLRLLPRPGSRASEVASATGASHGTCESPLSSVCTPLSDRGVPSVSAWVVRSVASRLGRLSGPRRGCHAIP